MSTDVGPEPESGADQDAEPDYDAVGFILASGYRRTVMEALAEGPAIPSKIAEREDVRIAHVSRTLGKLRERGLVELLVPEKRKKGREYGLTDSGRAALDTVADMETEATA